MPLHLSISEGFLESMAALDSADAKRAAAFVDKLIHAPEATSLRPEIVHDAADRSIRSFKVTHDLRAIAQIDGPAVLLLFVGRHDRAYDWVKGRCVSCSASNGDALTLDQEVSSPERLRVHVCTTSDQLCRLLSERSIPNDLRESAAER